jgi:hypothetical protein
MQEPLSCSFEKSVCCVSDHGPAPGKSSDLLDPPGAGSHEQPIFEAVIILATKSKKSAFQFFDIF